MEKTPLMVDVETRHDEPLETLIPRLYARDMTDEQIADYLGVSYFTYRKWLYRLGARKSTSVRFASEEATAAR